MGADDAAEEGFVDYHAVKKDFLSSAFVKLYKKRGKSYQVLFSPFDWQCPAGVVCITRDQPTTNHNDPVQSAWVRINYIPAIGSTPDQWIAEGEFADPEIQRGTLLADNVHRGQFSMPFRIRITALAPLQQ